MKTKSKSTQVFKVELWSKKYYGGKATKAGTNIWNGLVSDLKTGEQYMIHDASELLTKIREMYFKEEKNENKNQ